jgi:GNAT superfamily N-acetyltransferase
VGSIQHLFPKRRGLQAAKAGWSEATRPARGPVRVRAARREDFAIIHALFRRAAPAGGTPSVRELEARRHAFPAGQMVAERGGEVMGAASALLVDWERHASRPRWATITGEGLFTSHEDAALTLFAVDTVVDPLHRDSGIGRALCQARRQLCRRLNLQRILVTCGMPGYAPLRDMLTPERFAMRLMMGDIPDPVLGFYLAQGYQFCGVLRDFREGEHAALLAWLNPAFDPPRPPAQEEGRPRKCA